MLDILRKKPEWENILGPNGIVFNPLRVPEREHVYLTLLHYAADRLLSILNVQEVGRTVTYQCKPDRYHNVHLLTAVRNGATWIEYEVQVSRMERCDDGDYVWWNRHINTLFILRQDITYPMSFIIWL